MNTTAWQTDTAVVATGSDTAAVVRQAPRKLTPAQVLKWLPADATPEQQDSAIQAHIKPSPIHWSERPDTLRLPGQPLGESPSDVRLEVFYKESFFTADRMFHPELKGGRPGVAGDPVPYAVANDDVVISILLLCFMVSAFLISRSRHVIGNIVKYFFHQPSNENLPYQINSDRMSVRTFFMLQTCFMLAIVFFFRTNSPMSGTFIVEQYAMIGLLAAVMVGYVVAKTLLCAIVDTVFFTARQNMLWLDSLHFLLCAEGVLIYPAVLVSVFFRLSISVVFAYTLFVIIFFKLLSFYKVQVIFFKRNGGYSQTFLYFCTLELLPLLVLWGVLKLVSNSLKVSL